MIAQDVWFELYETIARSSFGQHTSGDQGREFAAYVDNSARPTYFPDEPHRRSIMTVTSAPMR